MNIATSGTLQLWAEKMVDSTSAAFCKKSVVYYLIKKKKNEVTTKHCEGTFSVINTITEKILCINFYDYF